MFDSVRPRRRQPTWLRRPWDSPGQNTGVGCHFLLQCMKVKSESEVAQSCPTLRDPMDCSPPGSSVRGIFQARVLEWGAIAFSGRTVWRFHKKTKNRATIQSCNLTPRHISEENHNLKRYMHPNVHCSTIYSSQDMEATLCVHQQMNG